MTKSFIKEFSQAVKCLEGARIHLRIVTLVVFVLVSVADWIINLCTSFIDKLHDAQIFILARSIPIECREAYLQRCDEFRRINRTGKYRKGN